jgi:hypothetical protein
LDGPLQKKFGVWKSKTAVITGHNFKLKTEFLFSETVYLIEQVEQNILNHWIVPHQIFNVVCKSEISKMTTTIKVNE